MISSYEQLSSYYKIRANKWTKTLLLSYVAIIHGSTEKDALEKYLGKNNSPTRLEKLAQRTDVRFALHAIDFVRWLKKEGNKGFSASKAITKLAKEKKEMANCVKEFILT